MKKSYNVLRYVTAPAFRALKKLFGIAGYEIVSKKNMKLLEDNIKGIVRATETLGKNLRGNI